MLRLNHVSKIYQGKGCQYVGLRDISLEIQDGELVAVIGPSGSGKSTLLNVMGGMDKHTAGEYYFQDINVSELSSHKLHIFRREHVSFVFQNFELIDYYTVYENIEVPLLARKVSAKERKKRIEAIMEQLGIEDIAKKRPNEISGGQQQRCAIARALVMNTDLILADEPTGALDSATSEEIMNILLELNQQGKTIVIVTHDPLVAEKCQRVIRIVDGKVE